MMYGVWIDRPTRADWLVNGELWIFATPSLGHAVSQSQLMAKHGNPNCSYTAKPFDEPDTRTAEDMS